MNKFGNREIRDIAKFNPSEKMAINTVAKKIPMGSLREFQRKIANYETSVYKSGPKFRNGDVLLAKITPCLENGKTAFVDILDDDEVAFGSTEFIVLRAKENSDNEYLYYLARSPAFRKKAISCMEGTSGRKRVNEGALKLQELLIPDKLAQQKIAAILSALDAKIDCNNRINAELEAIVKTLYDYWFVQFDFPDANGNPYKSADGNMVYNATLKREIPEGWEVVPLSQWIASDKTGDWGRETVEGNYTLCVDCIRGADINGLNGTGTVSPPTRFILEKNAAKVLAPFDFVIEISGGSPTQSTGRLALITEETIGRFSRPLICSNFCKAISIKDNAYFFNFAYLWKSAYDNKVLFGWEGKTSGIKNLLFDAFTTKHLVSRPPQKLAKRFFEFVAPIEAKKQKLLQETADLAAFRDWLLPLLMNGQVTAH